MKIDGTLVGFGDFFTEDTNCDSVGAPQMMRPKVSTTKKIPTQKTTSPGVKPGKGKDTYPKSARSSVMTKHGKVLQKAKGTLFNTARKLGAAQVSLARRPAALKTGPLKSGMKPVVTLKTSSAAPPVNVLKGKTVVIGAAAAATMSPKAKLAIQRHNAAVKKSKDAAKTLAQHALKAKSLVKDLAKKAVTQKKASKWARTPVKKRKGSVGIGALLNDPIVGEEAFALLEEYYDAVGADPDPNFPGYLTDGSPDPAYADPGTGAPINYQDLGLPTDESSFLLEEEPVDSGIELPPPPPMNYFIADMTAPGIGGIAYDESKGRPNGFAGSYNLFSRATDVDNPMRHLPGVDSTEHWGYVWGQFYDLGPEKGVPWGNDMPSQGWHKLHGSHIVGERSKWWDDVSEGEVVAQNNPGPNPRGPNGVEYGPIVGNPALPDFKGMRMDGKGNFFWLPQEAPDWLLFPVKQAAALTAQEEKKAADAEKKLAAAAEAKARADEAAALAAQAASNALAESAATSQAAVTSTAQEGEANLALIEQQKAMTTEQALETEQARQAGELMLAQARQQQEMMQQQAAMQQQMMAQYPELQYAAVAQQLLGPEGGEDEGYYGEEEELSSDVMESGEPIPGGDIMRDTSGEGYEEEQVYEE